MKQNDRTSPRCVREQPLLVAFISFLGIFCWTVFFPVRARRFPNSNNKIRWIEEDERALVFALTALTFAGQHDAGNKEHKRWPLFMGWKATKNIQEIKWPLFTEERSFPLLAQANLTSKACAAQCVTRKFISGCGRHAGLLNPVPFFLLGNENASNEPRRPRAHQDQQQL